jgi:hypothetical protein
MNAKQLSTVQRLTNRLARAEDFMTFQVQVLEDCKGSPVMLSGSNIDAPWYVNHEFFLAFVGPRGGVTVRHGSSHIRNMI